MKLKFFIITFIFLFLSSKSFAIPRCEELYKNIYNDNINNDVNVHTSEDVKTIGIRLDKYWEQVYLEDDAGAATKYLGFWKLKTNKDGYFIIGKITEGGLLGQLKVGDVILSINNIDLRELFKDKDKKKIMKKNISNLFEVNEKIEFKILRENKNKETSKIFKVNSYYKYKKNPILNKLRNFNAPFVDFNIRSISVNEKDGSFDASIDTSFKEKLDKRYLLTELMWKNLAYNKKYNSQNELYSFMYETCGFPDHRWEKLNSVDPVHGIKFDNLIQEYKHLKNSEYRLNLDIKPKKRNDKRYYEETSAYITYVSSSVYKIKNDFNLKTFPFDKQTLKVYLRSHIEPMEDWGYRAFVSGFTQKKALEFKESNQIQGWNITNVNLKYDLYDDPADLKYYDGIILELDVERKSRYYIFKIIFPIILILMICWSAVWIDPKEIESRLTITIVCLLSLIAYNFVIDSDLPKLEYLTIMDYIILISYVYAAIPNFLSIYSFQLNKTNKALAEKYEGYEKKYGLPSYILIVLLIIIINSTNSPEHTNSMFTWASMRQ